MSRAAIRFRSAFLRGTVFLFVFLFTSARLSAQAQVLPFRVYTMDDGLISNAVSSAIEDSRGFLWVGTMDGLSMFDGSVFRNYTMADGLPFSRVNAVIESRLHPGTIWIATNGGGIARLRNGRITSYRIGTTELSNRVNALLEDSTGAIWCGADRGLFILRGDTAVPFRPEFASSVIQELHAGPDGLIYILSTYKPIVYSPHTETVDSLTGQLPPNKYVVRISLDRHNRVWFCVNDSSLVEATGGHCGRRVRISQGQPFSLVEDLAGEYWAGSDNGLIRILGLDPGPPSFLAYTRNSGLPDNYMYAALCDREGDLWFFSLNNGLVKLSNRGTSRFTYTISADYGNPGNLARDRNGHLWAAVGASLIECRSNPNGTWEHVSHAIREEGVSYETFSLAIDTAGCLWVRARPAAFLQYEIRPGFPSSLVLKRVLKKGRDFPQAFPFNLVIDSRNRLWTGLERGLFELDPGKSKAALLRTFNTADGLPDSSIWSLYRDRKNRIWAGGYLGGVSVFDSASNSFRNYTTADGLADNSVRCVFEDSRGRIWIGTRYGGVSLFENGIFTTFNQKEGLLSNAVTCITEDDRGVIWFATVAGLQSMDGEHPGRFYAYPELSGRYVYSCAPAGNGFIAATAIDGIMLTDITVSRFSTVPPQIYIDEFRVNESLLDWNSALSLRSDQNNCVISFVGVSLRDGASLRYRYRLAPLDHSWRPNVSGQLGMKERSVALGALAPGEYTFSVLAVNNYGVESAVPAVLRFTIASPFWKTWWFISLMILTSASALVAGVKIRERQIIAMERMRSRIASDLHDDVGSGLIRIALLSEVIHRQAQVRASDPGQGGPSGGFDIESASRNVGVIARELVDAMNDVVWSIDPRNDSLDRVLRRIETFATELCEAAGMKLTFSMPENLSAVRPGIHTLRCLLLASKEALANCVRHSVAGEVRIAAELNSPRKLIELTITDNGRGFEPAKLPRVNGLENMKRRAEKVGGSCFVESAPGAGTMVKITLPV